MSVWGDIRNAAGSGLLNLPRPFSGNSWFVGSNPPKGAKNANSLTNLFNGMIKSGDVLYIAPGTITEGEITIPATLSNLLIIGGGNPGSVIINPSTEDANGMFVHGDNITLLNLDVRGEDTTSAVALTVTGANFKAINCKFSQGAKQVVLGPGTAAQVTAASRGTGANALFQNCEISNGTNGVFLTATDYGAVAFARFIDSIFYALPTSSFEETGGTVSARFTNLLIKGCTFERAVDGTAPTKWISLNDDNGNTGIVTGNYFVTALNSGLNLVSTKLLWAGNFHIAGLSTTQPS